MTTLEHILSAFHILNDTIEEKETFESFSLQCKISRLEIPDREILVQALSDLPERDKLTLNVTSGANESITLRKPLDIDGFIAQIEEEIGLIDDESVKIEVYISKTRDRETISIYNLNSFLFFLTRLPLLNIINLFSQNLKGASGLYFQVFDEKKRFRTANIVFSANPSDKVFRERKDAAKLIRENCNFGNSEEFRLTPDYFYLLERSDSFEEINILFDNLSLLFSIASIYNITSIDSTGMFYKLIGYRTFEDVMSLEEIDASLADVYFKIYNWIYSNPSNVSDKIGLARNVLSISLVSKSIYIEPSTFESLLSGYQIYLKENIDRYIDIRNKITDQLSSLSESLANVANNYADSFKKNFQGFLSFFVSIVFIRFLTDDADFNEIFTKDATILAFIFLFASLGYLVFSWVEFHAEMKRLDKSYRNLKIRFTDLLEPSDIEKIVAKDKDYNDIVAFMKNKRNVYSVLWEVFVVTMFSLVLSMSTYFTWSTVLDRVILVLSWAGLHK